MKNELEVVNIRLVKEPSLYSEKKVLTPSDAISVVAEELRQYDREVLCLLNLQTDGKVINMNIASIGTINSTIVSAREIFKSSILSNACKIIILHNHPSGNTTPSKEDLVVTEKLVRCGDLLDIPVLDHIIIGGSTGKTYSMLQSGKMQEIRCSEEKRPYNPRSRSR